MTIARKDIIDAGKENVYHCTTRCVRRAFLCGLDQHMGRDFEHRRQWVKDRLIFLSTVFALDIIGYSIMSNHLHVILRTRPDVTQAWSAEEVIRRWLVLHPPRDRFGRAPCELSEKDIQQIIANPDRVAQLRLRLGSISWFMGCLDEHIARRANAEDGCTGRFWEGRFKCQQLLDEAALLACMIYVDLNPIRAELAKTPEESEFTSAFDRIESRQVEERLNLLGTALVRHQDHPQDEIDDLKKVLATGDWLCPFTRGDGRAGIFKRLTLDEYVAILDATGRLLRSDKRGCIPPELAPVLERLSVNTSRWIDTICGYESLFRRMVGCLEGVIAAAHSGGRHWFQGIRACREAFCLAYCTDL